MRPWRMGGIDPPWWWKPWINPLAKLDDWWHWERPVKVDWERIRRAREASARESSDLEDWYAAQEED